MGLRIGTNVAALAAQRGLAANTAALGAGSRRLASGLRIDTAADDAAGSAIAARLRARIRSTEQARRNANDGIALLHTAEMALQEATSITHRLRELAVQRQSQALGATDLLTIGREFDALVAEVTRIGAATTFGGTRLFGSSPTQVDFHVGSGTGEHDVIRVTLEPLVVDVVFPAGPWAPGETGGLAGDPVPLTAQVDALLESLAAMRSRFGAAANRLTHAVSLQARAGEDGTAALSRVADLDHAAATAALARDRIARDVGLAVLGHANVQPSLALQLLET